MYKLVIQDRLPGLNELINKNRQNKYAGAKLKKDQDKYITLFVNEQLKDMPELEKYSLKIKWYEKNKMRDPDNIISGKKYILDSLVSSGKLKNDGFNNLLGLEESWHVDKNNPRIEVEIKGLEK